MSIGALPIATAAIASLSSGASSSGVGVMGPFVGSGSQGALALRMQKFWANEGPWRFIAKDSDGDDMIGTTDKDPIEKVWYELEFIDILRGADIISATPTVDGLSTIFSQALVSNGDTTHAVRLLIGNGIAGQTSAVSLYLTCSDGSFRRRTLKVRGRKL